jgi:hypothetical protein
MPIHSRSENQTATGRAAASPKLSDEGASMPPQLVTAEEDHENYGSELIDMTKRAAVEALAPELHQLRG